MLKLPLIGKKIKIDESFIEKGANSIVVVSILFTQENSGGGKEVRRCVTLRLACNEIEYLETYFNDACLTNDKLEIKYYGERYYVQFLRKNVMERQFTGQIYLGNQL